MLFLKTGRARISLMRFAFLDNSFRLPCSFPNLGFVPDASIQEFHGVSRRSDTLLVDEVVLGALVKLVVILSSIVCAHRSCWSSLASVLGVVSVLGS